MSAARMMARAYQGFQRQYPWGDPGMYKGGFSIFNLGQRINTLRNAQNNNTNNINILQNNLLTLQTDVSNLIPPINIFYTNNTLPVSPQQGDIWNNTSNGTEWFYDGTDWISRQLFVISVPGSVEGSSNGFISTNASTQSNRNNIRVCPLPGYSLKEVKVTYLLYFFSTTPLDGSNYYTIACSLNAQSPTIDASNVTFNSPTTITINNNSLVSINQHYFITFDFPQKLTIPQNGGIQYVNFNVTKVGTPATFGMLAADVAYKLVAPT
jgi:hypothetical protein